jgi:polyphosphate kinase 2 (PPK2 family)
MHSLVPDEADSELVQLQQSILTAGLPVMIIFEGSVGAVIGKVNTELIRCLEPRGVVYYHYDPADPRSPKTILDFML